LGRERAHPGQRVMYLAAAGKYLRLPPPIAIVTKRPRREGSRGLPAALSPLVTPSTPAVRTHAACSGRLTMPLPTTQRAHTRAGGGPGGTGHGSPWGRVQTWSVSPAAMAGVRGCQRWAEPLPWVDSGCGKGRRKLACGKQKL